MKKLIIFFFCYLISIFSYAEIKCDDWTGSALVVEPWLIVGAGQVAPTGAGLKLKVNNSNASVGAGIKRDVSYNGDFIVSAKFISLVFQDSNDDTRVGLIIGKSGGTRYFLDYHDNTHVKPAVRATVNGDSTNILGKSEGTFSSMDLKIQRIGEVITFSMNNNVLATVRDASQITFIQVLSFAYFEDHEVSGVVTEICYTDDSISYSNDHRQQTEGSIMSLFHGNAPINIYRTDSGLLDLNMTSYDSKENIISPILLKNRNLNDLEEQFSDTKGNPPLKKSLTIKVAIQKIADFISPLLNEHESELE